MAKKTYKPTMLTQEAYNTLNNARIYLQKRTSSRITFNDTISEFIGKKLALMELEPTLREYIFSFVEQISKSSEIRGVILYGSVAKGTSGKFSDIDLFIMIEGDEQAFYEKTARAAFENTEKIHKELLSKGIYSSISPLILSLKRLSEFSPLFLDILDYGIVLYDRKNTADDFLSSLRKIKHKRLKIAGVEVLEWT